MKSSTIISFFLLLPLFLYPQIWTSATIGLNDSYVQFDDKNFNQYFKHYFEPFLGIQYGADFDLYFSEALSLNIKTLYSQKGFKYNQTYIYGWKRYNYIQTTFAGKVDFNPFERNVFAFSVAPYLAYWLSGEKLEAYKKTQIILRDKIHLNNDTTFKYNRIDAGITFTFYWLHYLDKRTRLWINTGIDLGMVSNAKENVFGSKNRNYFFAIGIAWQIKK